MVAISLPEEHRLEEAHVDTHKPSFWVPDTEATGGRSAMMFMLPKLLMEMRITPWTLDPEDTVPCLWEEAKPLFK